MTLDTLEPNLWVVLLDRASFEGGSTDCLAAGRGALRRSSFSANRSSSASIIISIMVST